MSIIDEQQNTYASIADGLVDLNGISRIYMWQLRDANGNDRLGPNVCSEISRSLRRRGIGTIPRLRNQTQWDIVRIYKRDSAIGALIGAMDDMDARSDDVINDAAQCNEKVARMKELLDAD